MEVQLHSFLTLVPDGHEWIISCPSQLCGENPGTHRIGGWVGPRGRMDILEKLNTLTPARIRTLACPAHNTGATPQLSSLSNIQIRGLDSNWIYPKCYGCENLLKDVKCSLWQVHIKTMASALLCHAVCTYLPYVATYPGTA
jgi:hypothetical protein